MAAAGESRRSTQRRRATRWLALRLAVLYAVAAGLWILLSDRALAWLDLPPDAALRVGSLKGLGFVAVTAILLFVLALGFIRRLQASQEQYARQFENAAEALVVFRSGRAPDGSPDLEVVDLNPAAERRTGLPRERAVGRRMSRAEGMDEHTLAYFDVVAEAVRAGALSHTEIEVADGAFEIVHAYSIGQDLWALSALDITERKRAEREAHEWHELMQLVIQHDPNAIAVFDEESRYVFVSDRYLEDYRVHGQDVIGKHHYEVLPETPDRWKSVHERARGGEVVRNEEDSFPRADGQVDWVSWECRPWRRADGSTGGTILYSELVTRRRAEKQELRQSRRQYELLAADLERRVDLRTAQLEATNRELESFAYSISHDLRAPLRALDGFSEILLQDYAEVLDNAGRDYLRRIKSAANHMAGLMDGLLQLSRLNREELALQRVDLGGIAASIVAELREHEPGRDVVVDIAPDLAAEADPRLMHAVLDNLLGNAWKFTARHDRARIKVGVAQTDRGRAFYVEDDGAGFDMRYARNLFGAFQRLHTPDQFEGTGIGLATVQRIVHRHGGTVWAEGEVEKGATIWFTLEPPDPT